MPKANELKCYFGCVIDGPLHRYPKWEYPYTYKFNEWKSILDTETKERGNEYIYNNVRLCYRHFEEKYELPSHRLTKNATPTLNISFSRTEPTTLNTANVLPSRSNDDHSTLTYPSLWHGILPAECQHTADFLLIFDKLFDSFNGHSYQDESKIYKSCIKRNSPHFQLWDDLMPILESIKFKSIHKRNGADYIKYESIPSIKNWIQNIKTFKEMWQYVSLNHNVVNLIARNFNQDPLENFFSNIRSNGVRNVNPNCNQFMNAFKTLIINNYNSPHSAGANCEEDYNTSIQSLTHLIITNGIESENVDFACDIDYLLNVMGEIKINDSLLHVESKKYVTGYVIKKSKSKIFKNCNTCLNDLCKSEVDLDSFIYEVDYTKKSLFHPNDKFVNLMNDIYYMIVACLRDSPQSKYLNRRIFFFIGCACDFNIISCNEHKDDLIKFICNLSIKLIVHSWCLGVNRLLNGKITKFDRNDQIKKQAYDYYCTRKRIINKLV